MPTLVMISKRRPKKGLTTAETWVRGVFVVGYLLVTVAMLLNLELRFGEGVELGIGAPSPEQAASAEGFVLNLPRLFWTMVLPLVPLGIVIAGFYPWRKVCPLAYWGSLGRKLDLFVQSLRTSADDDDKNKRKPKARRVPAWAEAWYPAIALSMLAIALAGRLLLSNGDGLALGILLVVLGLGAAAVNWRFTGKTWCNFVCPVSIVERIYTEPNSLRREHNSQCLKCTACKKNCPDIDQENSYWKDVDEQAKRLAYFSFPGLVLAFYTYYYLRAGTWAAYFDGGWTRRPVTGELVSGPGFFFLEAVPAYLAAPLSLLAFMALSFALFWTVDRVLARWWSDEELRRHRMFTLAAFVAFNIFYVFAGAPSLRRIPYGPQVLAFAVPLVSTMFLVKRWRRSRKDYMEEKSAKKLLRKWKFAEPPPDDPAGVFAYFKAKEAAEEQQLAVYRETVREAYADEVVTKSEMGLLELLRTQLEISDGQHRKIMEELRAESSTIVSVEEELQLQGFREALTEALLGNASEPELRKLRREYAVDRAVAERVIDELKGERSPMLERVREGVEQIAKLRRDLLSPLASLRALGTADFALFVVERMQERALERVFDALPLTVASGRRSDKLRRAVSGLASNDEERREQALGELAEFVERPLFTQIAEVVREPRPSSDAVLERPALLATFEKMLAHPDPYLRVGAIHGAGLLDLGELSDTLAAAVDDEEPLVRETLIYAALRARGLLSPAQLDPLLRDEDPQIRRAAREAIEAMAEPSEVSTSNPVRFIEGKTLPPLPDEVFTALATADKLLFLRCVPLFAELDPEDLYEISRIARERTIPATGHICKQGDVTDDLYVLIDGQASVTVATPRTSLVLPADADAAKIERGEKQVAVLGPGDVVGELAAIDESPRSASVRPKGGPVSLLEIRGEDFRKRVLKRRDVAPKLMATLSLRLRETLARVR